MTKVPRTRDFREKRSAARRSDPDPPPAGRRCRGRRYGGELAAGVEAGVVTRDRVTDIGRVLSGDADGRRSAEDITLFDSTGLAIQDLAIARAAVAKTSELDLPTIDL